MIHNLSRPVLPLTALSFLVPQLAHAQTLHTKLVTDALHRPTNLVSPPGDLHRAFVTEQWTGEIRVLKDGMLAHTPFLTITDVGTGANQGLLGLAFHPDFATNGKLYVDVTDATGATHIRQYTVSASNADVADPASAVNVLSIPHPPSSIHNGGCLQFGPDGFLYQGMGDGGGADDPLNNAQNLDVLLGKLLRIDVDGDDFPNDPTRNYAIPPTNPFAGATAGADEIHSYGLRNPCRFSFDRVTGDLFLPDIGQLVAEELNFVPRDVVGRNFGWRCREGMDCTGLAGCACSDTTMVSPFHTYSHAQGCNVVGGFVYRGESVPSLHGTYFFADYCSDRIWSLRFEPHSGVTELRDRTAELAPSGSQASQSITSIRAFGEDARGELYVLEEDGQVWRIEGPPPGAAVCTGDGMPLVCPCAGNGYPGHGCPNSRSVAGALLFAVGTTTPDTVRLTATRMSATSACVFLAGTALDPAGQPFGDGVRCVTGALTRMSAKTAVHGAASFPEFHLGDASVSARSGATPGSGVTTYYQVFYRNAASFCLPASFNITNGYQITW